MGEYFERGSVAFGAEVKGEEMGEGDYGDARCNESI